MELVKVSYDVTCAMENVLVFWDNPFIPKTDGKNRDWFWVGAPVIATIVLFLSLFCLSTGLADIK